ncbi:PhzF family phenazine biosynthesis protein [Pseudorhodoferax sp. Leaf267]|uniref:PhzF family phenazine biosynthesis protein n=1 Tax=Pseudorhodoferax sp. Leaf267 TaxID=1736316 RepID=UPI0007009B06|nr:PhzF family phenazine biosynthesis protein [Pseudorhodoferax sp. Leaf267]KQP21765.1 phenazine biosynthesis protein PhzF [Pseudorhodoferax sp. Leaf267]
MTTRPFRQVDVFTDQPYFGNPLAVVLDAEGLSDAQMQRFAQWTNLSETTFVLPATEPGADYRVRIFTPGGELPFAGHPTLGTCHAWLEAGGKPRDASTVVQQSAVGLVRIRRDGAQLAFAAPPLRRSAPSPSTLAQVASALGLKAQQIVRAQVLDNGPVWFTLLLDDAQTVLRLDPDHLMVKALGHKIGVAALTQDEAPALIARSSREARAFAASATRPAAAPALVVRAFAACAGVPEDPVTGSLNASLAQWLLADALLPAPYTASQGACLGRDGLVRIARDDSGQVWVGGDCVTCIAGTVNL